MLLHDVLSHVELLRGVLGERIGAGQIGEGDGVVLIFKVADFGIDRDAAVVADLLPHAGGVVEEGGLAAVGVAHQGDVDLLARLAEDAFRVLGDGAVEQVVVGHLLGHGHHLHTPRLNAPQRHVAAHDLVLDGVAQRGVADDLHLLATHKTHLHEPVTEAPVARNAHDHTIFARLHIGERQHIVLTFHIAHCRKISHCKSAILHRLRHPHFWGYFSRPESRCHNTVSVPLSSKGLPLTSV